MTKDEYLAYLQSEAWKIRRAWKLDRAGHRCQICNAKGALHVHHRTYERVGNEREDDLTVLCGDCHALFHGKVPEPEAAAPEAPRRHPDVTAFAAWFARAGIRLHPTWREAAASWWKPRPDGTLTEDLLQQVEDELVERGLV
jgi:hypothetical protein